MFAISAAAALILAAPSAEAGRPYPAFKTKGAFFALSVPDLAAAARWYSEKLGLKVVAERPPANGGAMKLLEGGGLTVELVQTDKAVPLRVAAPAIAEEWAIHGVFKAGVLVEDWGALLATLEARGVPIAIGPFPATAEFREFLLIRDNNGNLIQFFGKGPN